MGTEKAKKMLKCINGFSRPSAWQKCREADNNFYSFYSPELNGLNKIAFKVLVYFFADIHKDVISFLNMTRLCTSAGSIIFHFCQKYSPTHHLYDTFQRK
jgi:hypothetical protein